MTKLNYFAAIISAFVLFNSQASANVITDVEEVNGHVGWFDSISWTHDLSDQDFTPGSVISAKLTIGLSDDTDTFLSFIPELATISVGTFDFQDGAAFYSPQNDWSGPLGLNSIAGLNSDGLLTVRIWSLLGDFNIGSSVLEVSTSTVGTVVPEPATLLLMSMGMIGLGASRMKKAKMA